jgi:hypothetical protein
VPFGADTFSPFSRRHFFPTPFPARFYLVWTMAAGAGAPARPLAGPGAGFVIYNLGYTTWSMTVQGTLNNITASVINVGAFTPGAGGQMVSGPGGTGLVVSGQTASYAANIT